MALEPSVVADSGYGRHLYWIFQDSAEFTIEIDENFGRQVCPEWTTLQKALINFCHGNQAIHDLPRIMRLPGTYNLRDEENAPLCRIIGHNDNRYTKDDFQSIIDRYQKDESSIKQIERSLLYDYGNFVQECDDSEVQSIILQALAQTPHVCDSYDDFVKLAMAFKSAGLLYAEVDEIFAQSDHYNKAENEEIYNSLDAGEINMGTAYFFAQYHNQELLAAKFLEKYGQKSVELWYDGYVFEKDNRTYIVKAKKGFLSPVEICNFAMRIEQKIRDDEQRVSWEICLHKKDCTETIELTGSQLNIASKFKTKIAEIGPFLCKSASKDHHHFVEYTLNISDITTKRSTQYLGRTAGKHFIFANASAVPGGTEELIQLIPPSDSIMRIGLPDGNIKQYWRETVPLIHEVYGSEYWKIIGFMAGSIFVDEIADAYGFYPLLFLNGQKGCGKSKLAYVISGCFGVHRDLKPFNAHSTQKAWHRQGMKYRGIPLVINEYTPDRKNNATLQQLYDREGYHMAKASRDLGIRSTEVNATFIVISTRQITGYESEAVASRIVTVDFYNLAPNKEKFLELQSKIDYLSSFVPVALEIEPQKLLNAIKQEIANNERTINADSRIIENHSILKCCADEFFAVLGIEPDYANLGISDAIHAQQETTDTANASKVFIDLLTAMVAEEKISPTIATICNGLQT